MKLTLGPIPFLWEKDKIFRFYEEIAQTPVSEVYIGEVVCSKRALLTTADFSAIAEGLQAAGKRVILSTLGILTDDTEMRDVLDLCQLPYPIEVNHMGVLHHLLEQKKEVIAGPHIALYNGTAVRFLEDLGIRRMVFIPELSRSSVAAICRDAVAMERELIVYGHLPLAFSWRCYTARAVDLEKDNCGIACRRYPEGMPLETLEGQPIFNINGTELVSAQKHCLLEHVPMLKDVGVNYLRIIPQSTGTAEIVDLFSRTLSGEIPGVEAMKMLPVDARDLSNGWFFGQPGWEYVNQERLAHLA